MFTATANPTAYSAATATLNSVTASVGETYDYNGLVYDTLAAGEPALVANLAASGYAASALLTALIANGAVTVADLASAVNTLGGSYTASAASAALVNGYAS